MTESSHVSALVLSDVMNAFVCVCVCVRVCVHVCVRERECPLFDVESGGLHCFIESFPFEWMIKTVPGITEMSLINKSMYERGREREGEREREKSKGSRKEEAATLFSVQHSQAKHSACRALPLC